jgi:hypothetical protein
MQSEAKGRSGKGPLPLLALMRPAESAGREAERAFGRAESNGWSPRAGIKACPYSRAFGAVRFARGSVVLLRMSPV